jgi:hypothetical protein
MLEVVMSVKWFEKLGLQHPVLDDNIAAPGRGFQPRKAIPVSTERATYPTHKASHVKINA